MIPLFASDWSHGYDVTDGGKWLYDEFNHGDGTKLLSVVLGGGPNGLNALRIQQRGDATGKSYGYAANLQKKQLANRSTDYRVSFYVKNDDTSPAGDHTVTCDIYDYTWLTYIRKFSTATDWQLVMAMFGGTYVWPIGYWHAPPLKHGTWYRLVYDVQFTDPTHIQVHPSIFALTGQLIAWDADFQQSDVGSKDWNGRSDWTLKSYYAAGYTFLVDPAPLTTFGVGNNGQQGATDTKQFWYLAGLKIDGAAPASPLPSGTYTLPAGARIVVP